MMRQCFIGASSVLNVKNYWRQPHVLPFVPKFLQADSALYVKLYPIRTLFDQKRRVYKNWIVASNNSQHFVFYQ
jgi:hypothetical protein